MHKLQNIVPCAVILGAGIWVAAISFTQTPAAAYIFPRLISAVFVALACFAVIKAIVGGDDSEQGITLAEIASMAPGVTIAFIYVFWAAKFFGFYTGTALTVFILISLYDPAPHSAAWSWVKRILITAGFMAVMYLLFAVILNVWTPREIFS